MMQQTQSSMKKAVILLSGGLDSATCLALAHQAGFGCYALSFSYGQRHCAELIAAQRVAKHLGVKEHRTVTLDIGQWGGSALTDEALDVPDYTNHGTIPITYVPARNTVFLAIALSYAEAIGAHDLFIGANAVDYSNYPDCRSEYISAFQQMANLATKAAIEGHPMTIHTPLMTLSKSNIIEQGVQLGVDYSLTVSCYQATTEGEACGRCDSCMLRRQGFEKAGIADPTHYQGTQINLNKA
jgi:7-cyano-7-deazaguanine synthase